MKAKCACCYREVQKKTLNRNDGKHCGRCMLRIKQALEQKGCLVCNLSQTVEGLTKCSGKCLSCHQQRKPLPRLVKPQRKPLSKALRAALWRREHPSGADSPCPVCEANIIGQDTYEAGHIIAHSRGGNMQLPNLVPICRLCNQAMGSQNMWHYKRDNLSHLPRFGEFRELIYRLQPELFAEEKKIAVPREEKCPVIVSLLWWREPAECGHACLPGNKCCVKHLALLQK